MGNGTLTTAGSWTLVKSFVPVGRRNYQLQLTVVDADGASASAAMNVPVANVAPTPRINIQSPLNLVAGAPFRITAATPCGLTRWARPIQALSMLKNINGMLPTALGNPWPRPTIVPLNSHPQFPAHTYLH